VKEALEGLPGVEKVEMDLERDLFRISYGPGQKPNQEAVLDAVTGLSYKPSIVRGTDFAAPPEPANPQNNIPPTVQRRLDQAKREEKLLMVKLTADW
jgi:hypothetical protein